MAFKPFNTVLNSVNDIMDFFQATMYAEITQNKNSKPWCSKVCSGHGNVIKVLSGVQSHRNWLMNT